VSTGKIRKHKNMPVLLIKQGYQQKNRAGSETASLRFSALFPYDSFDYVLLPSGVIL
jgi:hypothetical protein